MSKSRFPEWLKRPLLPVWNGGHRLAWRLGEYLGAVRHGRFGRCEVCGRFGPWLYRRRVIPPKLEQLWGLSPKLSEALARKESCDCAWCGAKLRARRLARVVLDTYPVGSPPRPAPSIAEWVRTPEARGLRVTEINLIEGLHEFLSQLPHLAFSDFESATGARSEDLTRLTYPDASLDLVLTSETLEHVSNISAALSEIRRVLVPGGRHLFTIPLLPGVPTTFVRTVLHADGRLEHRAAEIRHPGGDVGYPVFTEFGADFPEVLREAGFDVRLVFGPVSEDDVGQVFASRKSS